MKSCQNVKQISDFIFSTDYWTLAQQDAFAKWIFVSPSANESFVGTPMDVSVKQNVLPTAQGRITLSSTVLRPGGFLFKRYGYPVGTV